ncbi:FG-GAP-like repeat-containing protein [Nocardioides pyridinolyticus]
MPPRRTSFVTLCQQLLALGVVIAALTPAANVVSLDVVRETPGARGTPTLGGSLAAYSKAAATPARVSAAAVDPVVDEFALTAPAGRKAGVLGDAPPSVSARSKVGELGGPEVVSVPEDVSGYGAVGVTWAHGDEVPDEDLTVKVRTRTGDTWSEWTDLEYHDEHGPDPDSEEGQHARPGTDALLVGEVDQVQVRAAATDRLPADMKLAVIDPGTDATTVLERPALDTATMDEGEEPEEPTAEGDGDGAIALSAATYTPKPQIFSRAQWGADERLREKSSLSYFEVHAGFVHHTVNANDYSRAQVPALLRGIYAYHTQSRGWSDIGYNFLVDRFGRIWEGRYGGVDRPVVGAHTLNYNDYAFAMSAIGNYDVKQPSKATVQAYGALFAWKLSLHGVDASSTRQWVGSKYFPAINGHRDAASTACPGRYLYAKIPEIRKLAAAGQKGWSGRNLESNLAGTEHPDLIVRRTSDGKGVILPTGGLTGFGAALPATSGIGTADEVVVSPDLTGDGYGDLLVVSPNGAATVRPGNGDGAFGASVKTLKRFSGRDLVTAVGDLNADGHNDLVARGPGGRLDVFLGRTQTRFKIVKLGTGYGGYTSLIGAGDANGDGKADLIGRDADGALWLRPGDGKGGFGAAAPVPGSWSKFSSITGIGDFDKDGDSDLFGRVAASKYGYVIPSNGDGTYGRPLGPVLRTKKLGGLVGAAQVASDGTPDLVGRNGTSIVTLPNAGTTELNRPIVTNLALGNADLVLNAGDWDRDGHGDVIVRIKKTGSLMVRLGDGTGQFGSSIKLPGDFSKVSLLAAVGDMTGDGYPDLMGQPAGSAIRIYPGAGADGLRASYVAHSPIDAGKQVAVGRWNADGAPDSLFRKGNKLTLYPGNGPGGLTGAKALSLNLKPYDWVIGVSDVLLTGHADLIVRQKATGDLYLVQGTETGFSARRYLGSGMGAYDLAG